jgi:hypothetical protein
VDTLRPGLRYNVYTAFSSYAGLHYAAAKLLLESLAGQAVAVIALRSWVKV